MITNDLESFRKKNRCYFNIQLGKDLETQIYLIHQSAKELIISQALAADAIVVSKDRIIDGLDYLSVSIDEIKNGIEGMKSAFEFGISEVVWQIEQSRRDLKNLVKSMPNLGIQVKEIKKRARDYYANGLIDYAHDELLAAIGYNEYDFITHISLGMIAMFQKIDLDEAIDCFDKSITYARQKTAYYTSFALLYKARILREQELIDDARNCLEEAIELSPDCCELLYQMSIIEIPSNKEKAISLVVKLLDLDIKYSLKIEKEPLFDTIRTDLHNTYQGIVESQSISIRDQHDGIMVEVSRISKQITECNLVIEKDDFELNDKLRLSLILNRVIELADRKSLLDVYTAGVILRNEVPQLIETFKGSAIYYIDSRIRSLEHEKYKIHTKYANLYEARRGMNVPIIYSLMYIIVFVFSRSILLSIILSAIPFVIVFSIYEYNDQLRSKLESVVEDKLGKLFAAKDMI